VNSPETEEWRASALFYLVLGLIVVSGSIAVIRSLAVHTQTNTPVIESLGNLKIHRMPKPARAEAYEKTIPLFIEFSATWCEPCMKFQKRMIDDAALNKALQGVVVLKIMDTDTAFREYAARSDYASLNDGLPFFAILTPRGDLRFANHDSENIAAIVNAIEQAKK